MQIADAHNTSVPTVVLSWVLHEGAIIIPKSGVELHVKANANILKNEKIYLTSEDVETIRSLDGSIGKPWE